ncbi:unnamed protein product, partial [Allacma fusca]
SSDSTTRLNSCLAQLPTTDSSSLKNFQDWIRDSENFNLLVYNLCLKDQHLHDLRTAKSHCNSDQTNYLGSIGGTTVVNITGGILKKLFSRGFAIHVNYSGLNRQEAIKDSKLHHCIIESVRRHFPGQSVEEKVINKAIQNWFRGARDRHGGRKRPNKISGVEQNQAPQNQP